VEKRKEETREADNGDWRPLEPANRNLLKGRGDEWTEFGRRTKRTVLRPGEKEKSAHYQEVEVVQGGVGKKVGSALDKCRDAAAEDTGCAGP